MTTSDPQAGHVSMFDQLPDGGFRTELRGYDKAEVELKIRELEFANSHRDQMIHQLEGLSDRLRHELTEATSVSRETEQPSYSGLGARIEHLLRLAEEQASDLVAHAEAEAEEIRGTAHEAEPPSVFDQVPGGGFRTAIRGYDKHEVEQYVRRQEREIVSLRSRRAETDKQVLRLRHELAEATLALQEATKP